MPPVRGRRATAMKLRPAHIQRKNANDTARILANAHKNPYNNIYTPELLETLGEIYITKGRKELDAYLSRNRIDIPLATVLARLTYYGYRRKGKQNHITQGSRLERLHKLQRLLSDGTTVSDCARLLEVSPLSIYSAIRKYALEVPYREERLREKRDKFFDKSYLAALSTINITHPFLIVSDLHYPYTNWNYIRRLANLCVGWGGQEVLLMGEVIHGYSTIPERKGIKPTQSPDEINTILDDIVDSFNIMGFDRVHRFSGRVETTKRTLDHRAYGARIVYGDSVWITRNRTMQGDLLNTGIQHVLRKYQANILIAYAHLPRIFYDPDGPYKVIQLGSVTAEHRLPGRCDYLSKRAQRNVNGAVIMVPEGDKITPIMIDESTPIERMAKMYTKKDFRE